MKREQIDHFTVECLVCSPSSECEAGVDNVLIQTPFVFLWKLCLKNTSWDKNDKIYIRKQEGLYQSTPATFPFLTVNWSVGTVLVSNALIFLCQFPQLRIHYCFFTDLRL